MPWQENPAWGFQVGKTRKRWGGRQSFLDFGKFPREKEGEGQRGHWHTPKCLAQTLPYLTVDLLYPCSSNRLFQAPHPQLQGAFLASRLWERGTSLGQWAQPGRMIPMCKFRSDLALSHPPWPQEHRLLMSSFPP